jgi:hypothetical protein
MVSASSSKFVVGTVEACAPELDSKSVGGMGCDDPLRSKAVLLGSRSSEAESVAQHGTAAASQSHTMLSMVKPTGRGPKPEPTFLLAQVSRPSWTGVPGPAQSTVRLPSTARGTLPVLTMLAMWYRVVF